MERQPDDHDEDRDTLLGDADEVDHQPIEEGLDERLRDERDEGDEDR